MWTNERGRREEEREGEENNREDGMNRTRKTG